MISLFLNFVNSAKLNYVKTMRLFHQINGFYVVNLTFNNIRFGINCSVKFGRRSGHGYCHIIADNIDRNYNAVFVPIIRIHKFKGNNYGSVIIFKRKRSGISSVFCPDKDAVSFLRYRRLAFAFVSNLKFQIVKLIVLETAEINSMSRRKHSILHLYKIIYFIRESK